MDRYIERPGGYQDGGQIGINLKKKPIGIRRGEDEPRPIRTNLRKEMTKQGSI
jgi:hypothetical protein